MSVSQFTPSWFRQRNGRRRQPTWYRPAIQALEDRYLLSTFQEFPLPAIQRISPTDDGHRERITTGPDGNLWFTEATRDFGAAVGRIAPDGTVTEFSVEDPGLRSSTELFNITAGPDGNLWMLAIRSFPSLQQAGLVAIQVTPDGNHTVFQAFPDVFVGSLSPLVLGSDGNLWYTASFYTQFPGTNQGSILGRITPTGNVTNFDVSFAGIAEFGFNGGGITAGPEGNLWVGLGGVRPFTTDGHTLAPVPGSRPLSEMVTDANGNVWGLVWYRTIERITPDGTVTDFPLPVTPEPPDSNILDPVRMTITVGPDGNIWFSDPYANQIGNITPDGTVTEYAVPTPNSFPAGITTGPDGNIWFTELGSSQIGEFILNDGGPGARGAPAKSAPLASAVRSASVDALFASAQPDPLRLVALNQQAALAAVDAAFSASRPEVATAPPAKQAVADAGTMLHQHQEDRAEAAHTGLADPLQALFVLPL